MRAILQRVSKASVHVNDQLLASIDNGLLILLGVEDADTPEDIDWLVKKTLQMRIFSDEAGKMNLSVSDIGGKVIVVSQFTLHASTKKGNRPSFIRSAKAEYAKQMYEEFVRALCENCDLDIQTGKFGAMMDVALVNDGPVTIFIDSKNRE